VKTRDELVNEVRKQTRKVQTYDKKIEQLQNELKVVRKEFDDMVHKASEKQQEIDNIINKNRKNSDRLTKKIDDKARQM
jgi:uncharacterized coiled-coil DUF342 family protein